MCSRLWFHYVSVSNTMLTLESDPDLCNKSALWSITKGDGADDEQHAILDCCWSSDDPAQCCVRMLTTDLTCQTSFM